MEKKQFNSWDDVPHIERTTYDPLKVMEFCNRDYAAINTIIDFLIHNDFIDEDSRHHTTILIFPVYGCYSYGSLNRGKAIKEQGRTFITDTSDNDFTESYYKSFIPDWNLNSSGDELTLNYGMYDGKRFSYDICDSDADGYTSPITESQFRNILYSCGTMPSNLVDGAVRHRLYKIKRTTMECYFDYMDMVVKGYE